MHLLGCKDRSRVLPKHYKNKVYIVSSRVCCSKRMQINIYGSVVGVNKLNIMCNSGKYLKCLQKWGVCIRWTGLLDWTTGLDYWTDLRTDL